MRDSGVNIIWKLFLILTATFLSAAKYRSVERRKCGRWCPLKSGTHHGRRRKKSSEPLPRTKPLTREKEKTRQVETKKNFFPTLELWQQKCCFSSSEKDFLAGRRFYSNTGTKEFSKWGSVPSGNLGKRRRQKEDLVFRKKKISAEKYCVYIFLFYEANKLFFGP